MLLTVDLERLDVQPGHLVLDAGCGEGRHCFGSVARGARAIGFALDLDSMRDASKRLRLRAGELSSLGEMTQGNIFHGELTLEQLFFLRPALFSTTAVAPDRIGWVER